MKVLLQDTQTHLFFAGPAHWVKEHREALNLESIERAAQVYEAERFPFVEILVEEDEDGPLASANVIELERRPST